jgi:ankyrin repeat protein
MRQVTSRLRHRLQLGAAIVASVSAVYVVAQAINYAKPRRPIPRVQYIPPPPPPLPVPIVPRVIAPIVPIIQTPHLTAAFAAALREGDLKAMDATYTDESSLGVALKAAAADGKPDVVKWVLDKGADVHFGEGEVDAPILQADAHPQVVKLLLERGVSEAELSNAAGAGAPNAVGRILAKDKSAARPKDGSTPLVDAINSSVASEDNRRLVVDKLLAAGADPNDGDPLGASLAHCAADAEGCLPITKQLLARHPDVSGDALGAVIDLEEGPTRSKLLDTLLSGKLEPNATAVALSHVDGTGDPAMLKRLTARGVAWTFHDGENDAVAPFVDAVERQDLAAVRLMLDAGAPADYHYKDGRSALGSAIEAAARENGDAERIVEVLVQRGANVNRRLPDGRPPLFAAAESGDVRVVKAILEAGARVNERVLDETALDAAERSGHTPVARVLDGYGARRAPPRPVAE